MLEGVKLTSKQPEPNYMTYLPNNEQQNKFVRKNENTTVQFNMSYGICHTV